MSKGRGKKIAIKFDKPLLGDVSGNEGAFTISGMEKSPLFYGEPALREYAVDSVERYPIAELWQDDFSGTKDGVVIGENGLKLESVNPDYTDFSEYTTNQQPTDWTARWVTADHAWRVRENSGATGGKVLQSIPSGTTNARKGSSWDGRNYADVDIVARVRSSHKFAGSSRPLHMAIFCRGSGNAGSEQMYSALFCAGSASQFELAKYVSGSFTTFQAISYDWEANTWYWIRLQVIGTSLKAKIWTGERDDEPAEWTASGTDSSITGSGWIGCFTFYAMGSNTYDFDIVELISSVEYLSAGTYLTSINATELESPRFRYEANIPEGTSITVEYACTDGSEPTAWAQVDEGDLLDITDTTLWLRYTLATENPAVTPTLLAVWLEEAEAPPDTILLTMTEGGRFNNVEGDLTVAYNQALGNLAGVRPVESFEVSFAPSDLEPTPVHAHTITVRGEPVVQLIPVSYHEYPDHTRHAVAVTAGPISVAFIHVDDIPP